MAANSPSRSLDRFVVRLPDGMRERIADSAHANGRSMNAEVVDILNRALGAPLGLVLGEAEREYAALKHQLEDSVAVVAATEQRLATVQARLNELRRQHRDGEVAYDEYVEAPRPRPKGQFVPTAARSTPDIPDNLKPRR